MSRSSDPSPFAWIFTGALALVGLGAALSASRRRRAERRERVWAAPVRSTRTAEEAPGPAAEADDLLGAHPS